MFKRAAVSYQFSTEGLNECLAAIRAEQSRKTINKNTIVAFVTLAFLLSVLASQGSTLAFSHSVYQLIPSVPMPTV